MAPMAQSNAHQSNDGRNTLISLDGSVHQPLIINQPDAALFAAIEQIERDVMAAFYVPLFVLIGRGLRQGGAAGQEFRRRGCPGFRAGAVSRPSGCVVYRSRPSFEREQGHGHTGSGA